MTMRAQLAEADALAEDASADRDLVNMALEERADLKARLPGVEREMQLMLLPKDRDDEGSAVIEVQPPGTAAARTRCLRGDLCGCTSATPKRGWQVELVSATDGEMGGYKEVVAQLNGAGVFGRLKFESGVHRVQRVPATEAQGRIHTSAATVAILPVPEEVNIEIRDQDIRIDTYRSSGAGGQHVNKTDSAVRITHLPTNIVVTSSEKSQHENRRKAMEQLKIRLYEREREMKDTARAEARKLQVGSGDRSERIRTYNFPQERVTDHRINYTAHNLSDFVEGDIDALLDALHAEDQAERLAALENG